MSGTSMRGLTIFVSDIRNCQSRENEEKRVLKELGNIRSKFTGSKAVSAYDRRKYVWKLVYIYMIGYDFDFGHTEVINLISSNAFTEKQVGYTAASVLFAPGDDSIPLILETIRHDLHSTQDTVQALALSLIANLGGPELGDALVADVARLLSGRSSTPNVRKKAALCLLRMQRVNPKLVPPSDWAGQLLSLLDDRHLGVVLSVMTLVQGLARQERKPFAAAVPHVVLLLTRLAISNTCTVDYLYYSTPSPWLQVKLLQFLQLYPVPSDATHRARLNDVLTKIISHTDVTKSVNKNNADHSVLFEALNLLIHHGNAAPQSLREAAVGLLGRFLRVREPNIRYLGLRTMARMALLEGTGEGIRKNMTTVLYCLKESDVSIRLRALDLLYAMAHPSNAMEIVKELLQHLVIAPFAIKDEMVLKLAILAERFRPSLRWYVDTMLQMIAVAGDNIGDPVWFRVVQIVTDDEPDLQRYAALKMYDALTAKSVHETVVKVGGYIIGEFGYMLTEDYEAEEGGATAGAGAGAGAGADARTVTGGQQFAALHRHFATVSQPTQALLLTAYAKLMNLHEELEADVTGVLKQSATMMDPELQQRAVEYLALPTLGEDLMGTVLAEMPNFQTDSDLTAIEKSKKKDRENQADFDRKTTTKLEDGADAGGSGTDEEAPEEVAPRAGGAGGGAGASDAPAPAPAPAPAADPLGDIFSDDAPAPAPAPAAAAGGEPAPVEPTSVVSISDELRPKVVAWHNHFAANSSGVVFENEALQIGAQCAITGAEGAIRLYFGNRTKGALVSLRVRVPEHAGVSAKVGEVPSFIAAGAQQVITVDVQCKSPFDAPPALQVSFVAAETRTGYKLPLNLPTPPNVFMEAIPMDAATFNARWGALADKEAVVIVQAGTKASLEAAQALLAGVRFSNNIPPAGVSVYGAASQRTVHVAANGARASVGLLGRIDVNEGRNAYRVVVRAQVLLTAQVAAKYIGAACAAK